MTDNRNPEHDEVPVHERCEILGCTRRATELTDLDIRMCDEHADEYWQATA